MKLDIRFIIYNLVQYNSLLKGGFTQMSEKVLHLNEENFEEIVNNSAKPVFIDFWAPWCGPCRMLGPVVEEIANDFEGKVVVAKVNVDENQNLAQKFGVMSIPTMVVMKNGETVNKMVGFAPKQAIASMLEEIK